MRAYFFGNMYLSSIQQGIQAAHAVADMFVKYPDVEWEAKGSPNQHLHDWAANHKVMILLNGGYSETIRTLVDKFSDPENPYPWAPFHEGEDALDGALTTVGIILPPKIYDGASYIRSLPYREKDAVLANIIEEGAIELYDDVNDGPFTRHEISKWEFEFMLELNNFGLAK